MAKRNQKSLPGKILHISTIITGVGVHFCYLCVSSKFIFSGCNHISFATSLSLKLLIIYTYFYLNTPVKWHCKQKNKKHQSTGTGNTIPIASCILKPPCDPLGIKAHHFDISAPKGASSKSGSAAL